MNFNIDKYEMNENGSLGNAYTMLASQQTAQAVNDAATANKTNWLDSVTNVVSTGADLFSKLRPQQDLPAPTQQKNEFPWLPVALGGGAILTIYLLTKPKN